MERMRLAMQIIKRIRGNLAQYSKWAFGTAPISTDYTLLTPSDRRNDDGWQASTVAERQHQAFSSLLQAVQNGQPRQDFVVAARAVSTARLSNPLVIEVGCGSGYYSEVLSLLLENTVRYIGIDYAQSMTQLARYSYPTVPFVTGDACFLPLRTASCDILLSGTSLMHIPNYLQAISESVRVSKEWCIFHTVPVMEKRMTTLLRKQAYGQQVVEVIFNKSEIESLFTEHGLAIQALWESIPYDVSSVVGERTWTLTYLCRKI